MRTFDRTLGEFVAHICGGSNDTNTTPAFTPTYTGPELYGFRFERDTEDPTKGIGKIVTSDNMFDWTVIEEFEMTDIAEDEEFIQNYRETDCIQGCSFLKFGNKFIFTSTIINNDNEFDSTKYYVYDTETKEIIKLPYEAEGIRCIYCVNEYVNIKTGGYGSSGKSMVSKDLVEWHELPKITVSKNDTAVIYIPGSSLSITPSFEYIRFKNGKYVYSETVKGSYSSSDRGMSDTFVNDTLESGSEWTLVSKDNNTAKKNLLDSFKTKFPSYSVSSTGYTIAIYSNENNGIIAGYYSDSAINRAYYDIFITTDGGSNWTKVKEHCSVKYYNEEAGSVYIYGRDYSDYPGYSNEFSYKCTISFNNDTYDIECVDVTNTKEDVLFYITVNGSRGLKYDYYNNSNYCINNDDINNILLSFQWKDCITYLDNSGSIFMMPCLWYDMYNYISCKPAPLILCTMVGSLDVSFINMENENIPSMVDSTVFSNAIIYNSDILF